MTVRLTDADSVKAVLAEMTTEEKATLVTGGSSFGTAAIPRLGIPTALLIDGASGVNLRQYLANLLNTGEIPAPEGMSGAMGSLSRLVYLMNHLETPEELEPEERELLRRFRTYLKKLVPSGELPSCFPANSLLASSWDPETVYRCGCQVGREASAFGVDMLLGTPCINIQRDPRGGRGFEGYSEDPYLISALAPWFSKGVQEQGVCADVKHFAMNNQETNRQTVNELISERALEEIYLPGFRACVQEGGVRSVMTGYNWINGTACAHNDKLIRGILRGRWGFGGTVVSDWGGVYDQAAALQAGNDLCMPGPRDTAPVLEAIRDGSLSDRALNEAAENILRMLTEMPVMRGRKFTDIDAEASRRTAYEAAAEGMVLLKNKNGVLPLTAGCRVALFGEACRRFLESGVGSGHVHTDKTSSLLARVQELTGKERVSFGKAPGGANAVVAAVSAPGQEGADRENLRLPPEAEKTLCAASAAAAKMSCPLILLLNAAGPVELTEWIDRIDALVCLYFPGEEGGRAAADLLFGQINPSGRLAQTFPRRLCDCPAYGNFPGEYNEVRYGEGVYVGYRYYDAREIEPLFPFGFGLSYTTFALSNLRLNADRLDYTTGEKLLVSVDVVNTGRYAGKEVVQLYLEDEHSTLPQPPRQLKGFAKLLLAPGETGTALMQLGRQAFSCWDPHLHAWVCEPGWFRIRVGVSSRDLPLTARIRVVGKNPYGYGPDTQFVKIAANAQARRILLAALPENVLNEESLKRQTAYVAFSFTLRDAWERDMRPRLKGDLKGRAEELFHDICEELGTLDPEESEKPYRETEIF